ncbi:MAG: retropepsin-like domain-containing protein [Gemmataceae bacterium]|nr:retropepsin-like domain-containing protein [Gemmataceae bacterium]
MSVSFQPDQGAIVVPSVLQGPSYAVALQVSLDTGASMTMLNIAHLLLAGYDPALATTRFQITTAIGIVSVPQIVVARLTALGQSRSNFPVLAHTLPADANVDGLLGLDFFQGHVLTIDFRNSQIDLH